MTRRCFISVDIEDDKVRQRLAEAQKDLAVHGHTNTADPTQFHITLNFIGDVNDDEIDIIKERLSRIDQRSFTMDVNGIGVFPSEEYIRVVWAGADNKETTSLAAKIRNRLLEQHVQEHDFHGHVTLFRVKDIGHDEKQRLKAGIQQYRNSVFGSFTVDGFALKESKRTPEGAQHTVIQEFDLQ